PDSFSHAEKEGLVPMLHTVAEGGQAKADLMGREGLMKARERCRGELKKFPEKILSLSPGEPVIDTRLVRAR
ncbi:MAG: hypothetical protein IIW04_01170, partial [Aeriscardovia sp.]|nr:hypothetical protein [Aeriscardovia sp.]